MLNFVDNFLDTITMYQLVWWVLRILIGIAVVLAFFGFLSYSPWAILITCLLLVYSMLLENTLLGWLFHAPLNTESIYITALILTLILTPAKNVHDILFILLVGLIATASKFILTIKKKHLCNPAAIAVVASAFLFHTYASWWIGTASMFPFVVVSGIVVVEKVQRSSLVWTFLIVATLSAVLFGAIDHISLVRSIQSLFLDSAIVFFATIMLTEPLTTPQTRNLQIMYAAFVGFLFTPQVHIGAIFSTPELALVIGNVFSYIVSPKQKLMLTLQKKIASGDGIAEFIFTSPEPLRFRAGQYMEWTLPHKNVDSRGNRRYFTLASSPTEKNPHLGVRFYPQPSSFKKALNTLPVGSTIAAGSVAGEFTLPKDPSQKLVFVAGGIGITPFRSMITYLVDKKEKRDIVLLYINKTKTEIRYKDIFTNAQAYGVQTIYRESVDKRMDASDLQKDIPDFLTRTFYLSGSHTFVKSFEDMLTQVSIPKNHIKKDFFPGLA